MGDARGRPRGTRRHGQGGGVNPSDLIGLLFWAGMASIIFFILLEA